MPELMEFSDVLIRAISGAAFIGAVGTAWIFINHLAAKYTGRPPECESECCGCGMKTACEKMDS